MVQVRINKTRAKRTILNFFFLKSCLLCLLFVAPMECSSTMELQGSYVIPIVTSWYGSSFHGKQTANQEIFDMYEYTAAHKTLPFGTVLHVYNPETDKDVYVRINDRGPFIEGRDLDLSYIAAHELNIIDPGVVELVSEISLESSHGLE